MDGCSITIESFFYDTEIFCATYYFRITSKAPNGHGVVVTDLQLLKYNYLRILLKTIAKYS